jgi:hypothetical protein
MNRSEIMQVLAGTADEDIGDVLLELAADWWREQGESDDDIVYLLEMVLEDSNEEEG